MRVIPERKIEVVYGDGTQDERVLKAIADLIAEFAKEEKDE